MKAWLTIEPTKNEVTDLIIADKKEGVSRTPLQAVINHAYLLMEAEHEVSLKITTLKWREGE